MGYDAFPDGIPFEIARGRHDHKAPIPSDDGIWYEQPDRRYRSAPD